MIEAIVTGLFLALVSGITFFAYKHPHAFRTIISWLAPIAILLALNLIIFTFAYMSASIRALANVLVTSPDDKIRVYASPIESLNSNLTYFQYTLAIAAVVGAYIAFLWYLPRLIRTEGRTSADSTPSSRERNDG